MSKQLLNEAERFLLDRWEEARILEGSMNDVRTKYKELYQRIIVAVTERHPELDENAVYLTQSWTPGELGFSRSSWPHSARGAKAPAGIWLTNLKLDSLTAEETDPPFGNIWVPPDCTLDFDAARIEVSQAAKELLSPKELEETVWAESGDNCLIYLPAPTKRALLDALPLSDGQGFVDTIVSQFDMMARFIPVLDLAFGKYLKKE